MYTVKEAYHSCNYTYQISILTDDSYSYTFCDEEDDDQDLVVLYAKINDMDIHRNKLEHHLFLGGGRQIPHAVRNTAVQYLHTQRVGLTMAGCMHSHNSSKMRGRVIAYMVRPQCAPLYIY
jgi:hypothetical protein